MDERPVDGTGRYDFLREVPFPVSLVAAVGLAVLTTALARGSGLLAGTAAALLLFALSCYLFSSSGRAFVMYPGDRYPSWWARTRKGRLLLAVGALVASVGCAFVTAWALLAL